MTPAPARIAILGGGTAGWMAAALMQQHWPDSTITLIESPDIGIIGVGEGSTPQLKALFDTLGIAETDWMPRANATYKAGIRFDGWSRRAGFESYFHPFATDVDPFTAPDFFFATRARRAGHRHVDAHPDRWFLPTQLASDSRAPVPPENFPFDVGYGYHFDAHGVGMVLRDHAVACGVSQRLAPVEGVDVTPDRTVAALILSDGERVEADLFVDCSGFAGLIVERALGEPFVSFADNLFCDRAVVMPSARLAPLRAQTTATTMSAGWRWTIPLTHRTGNGYVYSSRYISDDAAAAELRAAVGADQDEAAVELRVLKMKVGRLQRNWVGNALAIGLSQGFIEPLEATALHLVQSSITHFIAAWPEQKRDAYNAYLAARFEGIRDYIVAHYRMNQRDGAFWADNAANHDLSDSLKALITTWFTGGDLSEEIERQGIGGHYTPVSWHCLFAGYGTFPADDRLVHPAPPGFDRAEQRAADFVRRCALNFPDHADALSALASPADRVSA